MYGGIPQTVEFVYSGPAIESVLDRLPTAEVKQNSDGSYTVKAETFGKGILMWLLSQGSRVTVLGPQELRDKWIDEIRSTNYPIKVNFGLEVCWFEQHEDYIRNLLNECDFDYVLGSVHWIDNWTFNQRKYQWLGKNVDKLYKRYYEMSNTLIKSDIFDIIAHPDLIRCHGIYPKYDLTETYYELCENAKAHNVMVEMNTSKGLGLNSQLFDIAKQVGVKFSTGSDAHCPENVGKNIFEVTNLIKV